MKVINKISDDLIEIIEFAKPNACFQTNEYPDNYDFVVLKEIISPFDLYNDNKVKDKEIEKLHSIIKEVREYIQDRYDGEVLTHTFDKDNVKELLEILDKVEENTNGKD